ncbi:MAG: hypothetical protein HYR86_03805 [Candidatus Rokubacteria bacterium]|nr:hypothetical protein [Candidatus Rokubacteria bacterium]
MTRLIALLIACALVAGTTGVGFAQKPAPRSASGSVKSASADSIVVTGKDKGTNAEWTFAVHAGTRITKAGKDATAGDLKPGDAVEVRYVDAAGKARAEAITVRAPGAAKVRNPCAAAK